MTSPWTVTPLTADAALQKRHVLVAVLSAWDRLHTAGVAFKTFRFNRTHQEQLAMLLIAWSQVPFAGARVIRHRGLKEKIHQREEIASAHVAGTDEVRQLLCAMDLWRTRRLFLIVGERETFCLL